MRTRPSPICWSLRLARPRGERIGVKMGTTIATNALLERKGDPVLLIVSQGSAMRSR